MAYTSRMGERSILLEDIGPVSSEPNPHLRLWASVLLLALSDLSYVIRTHKSFAAKGVTTSEPYNWLFNPPNTNHPGSFTWICHILGYDPEVVQQRIRHNWRNVMQATLRKE